MRESIAFFGILESFDVCSSGLELSCYWRSLEVCGHARMIGIGLVQACVEYEEVVLCKVA